ncbi:glycosyltransferase family 4 protein [Novosphingopyxis sp. YJ-S2-01]|uniref:glycosyltransferase family 4 protein n=1 Tax=Novosphingopyxis sp. YJ-S2-01 TaxID=2794021 RepID=UPI0018DB65D3|nr:glycosyltransferase family 4 protein [Novosphingopyxis sp. YJ-S2-01]MBH9538458.1 glycosyltransferase family 4 protein [Novosphingopyxis sp. YJ-S2-01]
MPSVLVLCPYPQGVAAGQRLKYEQYLDEWRAAGFDVTVSSFIDLSLWDVAYVSGHRIAKIWGTLRGHLRRMRDLTRIRRYDIVYVAMWVTPFGTTWAERTVRKMARALVYDIEDNLLTDDGAPRGLRQKLKGRGKARYLLEQADHVITASPFMVDRYRALNGKRSVSLIYPSVDTETFRPCHDKGGGEPPIKPVIGWTGTFSSVPYLDLLRPVLQELARRLDYKLVVIGNFEWSLPGVDLEVLTWSREEEVSQMQRLDIGLYPLPDDDWVLGKAGLKVIQYMAFGIPSVSSSIGTAVYQVTDGVDGYLVRTDEEWLDVLERLCRDRGERERTGAAARAKAVKYYSREATGARYLAVLEEMTGRPGNG